MTIGEMMAVRLNGVRYVIAADVRPERLRWLWRGRIPLGKLTMVDGLPGMGKSLWTVDLAARVSRGDEMPDGTRPDFTGPAGSVLFCVEDGLSDTVRPRLNAAGADVRRVVFPIEIEEPGETPRLPTINDVRTIGEMIEEVGAKLVVFDPFFAYLPSDLASMNSNQDVRPFMLGLARVAEERQVAIVLIRHLNKGDSTSAVERGGGAMALIGTVRAGLLIAPDPRDRERVIVAVSKKNLARELPALAYRPVDEGNSVRIVWEGEAGYTADQLLDPAARKAFEPSAEDAAIVWLREALAGGERLASEVEAEAARASTFGVKALRAAKKELGVVSSKHGLGGPWFWRLPEDGDGSAQLSLPEGAENEQGALKIPEAGDFPRAPGGPPALGEERASCPPEPAPRPGSQTVRCMAWLREHLLGETDADAIGRDALAAGFSVKTLRSARERLGVRVRKAGGGPWLWRLPAEEGARP